MQGRENRRFESKVHWVVSPEQKDLEEGIEQKELSLQERVDVDMRRTLPRKKNCKKTIQSSINWDLENGGFNSCLNSIGK